MFGRKKEAPTRSGKGKQMMQQMGWTDVDDMQAAMLGDDDDADLEAELLALTQGDDGGSSPKKGSPKKKNDGMAAIAQLDSMVAQCMADLPDNDDDIDDGDLDDPDLLAELQYLEEDDDDVEPPVSAAPPPPPAQSRPSGDVLSVLQDRLNNYQTAHANAKAAGDSSKTRRADRGIKTLKDMVKKARAGKPVAEDDIPPAMAVTAKPKEQAPPPAQQPVQQPVQSPVKPPVQSPAQPPAPKPAPQEIPMVFEPTISKPEPPAEMFRPTNTSPPKPVVQPKPAPKPSPQKREIVVPSSLSAADQKTYMILATRKEQYYASAIKAKGEADKLSAAKYLRTSKQFEAVLQALSEGKDIDLSKMPSPPPGYQDDSEPSPPKIQRESRQAAASVMEEEQIPETTAEDKKKLYKAPEATSSTLEALMQRLEKYKSAESEAKEKGDSSKARRHGRIVKQYQSAVKSFKAGKPIDYDELPSPPGFPPIPRPAATAPPPQQAPSPQQQLPKPAAPARQPSPGRAPPQQPTKTPPKTLQRQMSSMSRAEQQTLFLQDRQIQFKKAALKAKQNGDMELAKKYMKNAMGFNPMIEASQGGLPVNMEQIPPPPGVKEVTEGYEFVEAEATSDQPLGDRDEEYKKLEQDLITQIRMCATNSEHFTKLGDVSSATKFDKMSLNARRDLDAIKNAYKHGDPVPRFHYETRHFSLVRSCSELGDNDLEIIIVRGLNYPLPSGYQPKDLDTYVKFEFPFPNEEPQKGDTNTCKDSTDPEYNQSFKVTMNRKSRVFHRMLKNKSIKFEVLYKRGFLKGDKTLGTVAVKLLPLENTCVMHDSYDLMDGRKSVGGKLEIKVRVRDPFFNKEVEEVKERWLVIDHFDRKLPTPKGGAKPLEKAIKTKLPETSAPVSHYNSMEVLKYEKSLLDQQIQRYKGKLDPTEIQALMMKADLLDKEVQKIRTNIKQGGVNALRAYVDSIERLQNHYLAEAKTLVAHGQRDKATILMTKKKYVEKEVETIRSRLSPT